MTLSTQQKNIYALLVFIMIPLAGMSTDIYLPSLPAIATNFGVSKLTVQMTVTSYVFAVGISQLIAGPISDAIGRRKLLIGSLLLQIFSVASILMTHNIYVIIMLRFTQGLGAAFMGVPARAILNDIYEGEELKKKFNYCTISFALGPIIAPFIGGYLQHYFGWHSNFIFILVYAVLILALIALIIKETIPQKLKFSIHHLYQNYQTILSNKTFLIMIIFIGCLWGYGGMFNVAGPFLVQKAMGFTPVTYGYVALTTGFAWFLGNLTNRFLFKVSREVKTKVALMVIALISVAMLVFAILGNFNLFTLVIPTVFIMFFAAILFPLYIGECLVMFPKLAGSANACLFGATWLIYSFFTVIGSTLKSHSLTPISICYVATIIAGSLVYTLLTQQAKKA